MTDKWLDDIKEKISDFEMDAPEGLWESIENDVAKGVIAQPRRSKGNTWPKIMAVAAVMLLLIGLAVTFFFTFRNEDLQLPKAEDQMLSMSGRDANPTGKAGAPSTAPVSLTSPRISNISKVLKDSKNSEFSEVSENYDDSENSGDSYELKDPSVKKDPTTSEVIPVYDMPDVIKTSKDKKMLAIGASFSASSLGDTKAKANGSGPIAFMDNGAMTRMGGLHIDIDDLPPHDASKDVFEHKLPLRFAADVSWNLNKNLSIGTGLTYTLLRSEIRYGSFLSGRASQSLHYVGIPIKFRYTPISWNNFNAYVSAGVLAEKCVAGSISDNSKYHSRRYTYDGASDRPFQFSVNAGIGLQYDITKTCGIFIEPNVGYYFEDGSSLRNIYEDKPLNFNLNIGFRFSLPKK